jgi:hypothetical protein
MQLVLPVSLVVLPLLIVWQIDLRKILFQYATLRYPLGTAESYASSLALLVRIIGVLFPGIDLLRGTQRAHTLFYRSLLILAKLHRHQPIHYCTSRISTC